MLQVKIVSNPYENTIAYYKNDGNAWSPINDESSKLIRSEYQNGVFPFLVKKIVDILIEEYKEENKKLDIVFEGTDDEYKDLKKLCAGEKYRALTNPIKSDRFLSNGSAIIKDVERIFSDMEPLIQQSCDTNEIKREKEQFKDVTKKVIPICVIGNYSAGKSTFINALIGREILPSADQSLTSRIYRIEDSKSDDKASIAFEYGNREVILSFEDGECTASRSVPFIQDLVGDLEKFERKDITFQLNKVLEIINDRGNDDLMSFIIRLSVPFNHNSVFGISKKEFVIFDTPGDNTATNMNHQQVLRRAMQDLSNGLPVFVSENRSLDSTDNQKLCNDILSMPELDRRYTMIIVNKADDADLDEETFNEERILNQAAPKSMFSGGMYFVSSIVGLGSKTDGKFIDNHYTKLFRRLKDDFSGEDEDYCEKLYKFDIMPAQIKAKLLEDAPKVENQMLLNSGLHWIECEIIAFAEKYSPYNKCTQSKRFLDKVIEITMNSIKGKISEFEAAKKKFSDELDDMKGKVINSLDECLDIWFSAYKSAYDNSMSPTLSECHERDISMTALENWEKELTEQLRQEVDFDNRFNEVKVDGVFNQMLMNWQVKSEKKEVEAEINDYVSDGIIQRSNVVFTDLSYSSSKSLNTVSSEYWVNKSEELKSELLKLIKGSAPLSESEKDKLSEIIANYGSISLKNDNAVFIKEDFKVDFTIFGIHFGNNKISLKRLKKEFKKRLDGFIDSEYNSYKSKHMLEFEKWSSTLMQLLKDNIVEYNPDLTRQNKLIQTQENEIIRLQERRQLIEQYNAQIVELMSWQEREID